MTDHYAGEKVRCAIPLKRGDRIDNVIALATLELERKCREHGMTATNITLVSVKPWTESVDGMGPYPGFDLHIYEATAVECSETECYCENPAQCRWHR